MCFGEQGVFLLLHTVGDAPHISFSLGKSLSVAEEGVVVFAAVVFGCRLLAVIPGNFIGWAEWDQPCWTSPWMWQAKVVALHTANYRVFAGRDSTR